MTTTVLLGPQRFAPQVPEVLAGLGHDGAVATVTAGWGEREADDADLRAALGGATVPLRLYARWRDVVERDPSFAAVDRERRDRLEDLQQLYALRLHHAIAAVRELWRQGGDPALRATAVEDAVAAVRDLDEQHVMRQGAIDAEFHARHPLHERPVVARHRREVAELVADAGAVAIAGGHVGVLARCLHLVNLAAVLGGRPVVAWSAGAMAVAERIVLFHDHAPHGPGHAEVHGVGIGLVRGVLPLPHAARRLRLGDRDRMRLLARRFAPDRLVPMDGASRLDVVDGVPAPAVHVAPDGALVAPARDGTPDPAADASPTPSRGERDDAERDDAERDDAERDAEERGVEGDDAERDDGDRDDGDRAPARLAIDALRHAERVVDAAAVDAFMADNAAPVVEGDRATFLYRGEADAVRVQHRVVGLPPGIPLQRLEGTDLWYAVVHLPAGSRVEYHLEVERDGHVERRNDPHNPHVARNPFGTESVARADGYEVPDWVRPDPEAREGTMEERTVRSDALGRDVTVRLHLPARFRPTHRYPLLVVHDGDDFLEYADARTVLDNLVHRNDVAEIVTAFISSPDRLVEYGDDPRHHRFVVEELVPHLEAALPLVGQPRGRCLVGASFGGIAAFGTALAYPGEIGALLLASTSFAVRDIGGDVGEAMAPFQPVVELLQRYRARPVRIADRIYQTCGAYEPMIAGNRAMVPVLQSTGARVRYVEARDGHNWENWRDRLRDGLSWLFPGAHRFVYE